MFSYENGNRLKSEQLIYSYTAVSRNC